MASAMNSLVTVSILEADNTVDQNGMGITSAA
jgi:hypothetical protein